jgi:hypothetical protein
VSKVLLGHVIMIYVRVLPFQVNTGLYMD